MRQENNQLEFQKPAIYRNTNIKYKQYLKSTSPPVPSSRKQVGCTLGRKLGLLEGAAEGLKADGAEVGLKVEGAAE